MNVRFAFIVGVAVAVALGGCSQSTAPTSSSSSSSTATGNIIKVGVDFPLSGADASDGIPSKNGVLLAVADANKAHLIPGYTIQADVLDDAVNGVHDPAQGVKNIQSFANDAAVVGVVGPFNSNVARAEIPQSNSLGIALVSPANTNPTLTKGPDAAALRSANPSSITYFRVCTTDDIQGPAGATFAFQKLGKRKAYVIDDNETYGLGLANAWAATFTNLGGAILGHDHITQQQQDFHALLTRVSGTNPDLVFYGGTTSTGGGLLRKQMGDSALGSITYAGGDGIQDAQFLVDAGSMADNVYATVASPNASKMPAAQKFIKDYQAMFGQPVGPYSANSYVAAMVIIHATAAALKANGGQMPTRLQVLQQLRGLKNFTSITGTFSFDPNGDTTARIITFYEAKQGQWVFVTQQNFASLGK